ncbi:MAG: poly-gamma-glutamate hydrolase family protein [Methylococcales bacterium]|nr:poly-gamma-glutamate hydrolase family protein [Methylococcales bacterium]
MHVDRYRSYEELKKNEWSGRDFAVCVTPRPSTIAVIAPHGGLIEPRTTEIASQIAGEDFNLYLFQGTRAKDNYAALHITSHRFDEPSCLALLSICETVVAIHGCKGEKERVMLGGLDASLKNRICDALQAEGLQVETENHAFLATDQNNICNRGRARKGVQLELTHALRGSSNESQFVSAVRKVLLALQHT